MVGYGGMLAGHPNHLWNFIGIPDPYHEARLQQVFGSIHYDVLSLCLSGANYYCEADKRHVL